MDRKFYITGALFLLAAAGVTWWILKPDPLEAFRRDVQEMTDTVNGGDYSEIPDHLSEAFRQQLESTGTPVGTMTALLARVDREQKRSYRVVGIQAFQADGYAEVLFERSGPGGVFDGKGRFVVPFVREKGGWKVAQSFKDGKNWNLRPLLQGFSY
jgi:hypothetical protein